MQQGDPVRQQIAEALIRKAVDDELRHAMQIRARVDPMGNAGAEDRKNGRGSLATKVPVGREPVFSPEHQGPQLALDAIVRQLDAPVREEQCQAEAEKQAAPEALISIASVPTPGGPIVVGLGPGDLYRFDNPLGAAVPIVDFHGSRHHSLSAPPMRAPP